MSKRFFQPSPAVFKQTSHVNMIDNAKKVFNNYFVNERENNADAYLAVLRDVFKLKIDDVESSTPITFPSLTATPEQTAIAFLIFAEKLLSNKQVREEFKNRDLLKLNHAPKNMQVKNIINELKILTESLNVVINSHSERSDYINTTFKQGMSFTAVGLVSVVVGGVLGGPVGAAIAVGIIAAVGVAVHLITKKHSQGTSSVVEESLENAKRKADLVFGDSPDKSRVRGFMELLGLEKPQVALENGESQSRDASEQKPNIFKL